MGDWTLRRLRSAIALDVDGKCEETRDRLLLCSDGLHSSVSQGELTSIICSSGLDLEQLTDTLIENALSAGGDDNITVLITGIHEKAAIALLPKVL